MFSCEHEPFPAPPPGVNNPGDTTNQPIDTSQAGTKPCHPDTVYFKKDILPILSFNCVDAGCHNSTDKPKGIILDSYNNVMATAKIKAFDTDAGKVVEMLEETDPDDWMPKGRNKLPQAQIDLIKKWINQGALNLSCDDCDTANLSFSANVKPIFDGCAQQCHSGSAPSAGLHLTTHAQIVDAVQTKFLLDRINHVPGFTPMPFGGVKLDACRILKIEMWVAANMPNN